MAEFWQYINNSLPSSLTEVCVRIVGALLIVVIGFKLTKLISRRYEKVTYRKGLDQSTFTFLKSFVSIALKILILVTAASVLGVPLTAIITALGSAGLAIGLALQGSLSNLAGGVMLLIFRPFSVGDYISNHTDDGTVTAIGIFYTKIVTPDNRTVVIPNGTLTNQTIINYSQMDERRVDVEFRVPYGNDVQTVIEIIKNTVSVLDPVNKSKPVEAFVTKQDNFGNIISCRAWCLAGYYWDLRADMLKTVTLELQKHDITIR